MNTITKPAITQFLILFLLAVPQISPAQSGNDTSYKSAKRKSCTLEILPFTGIAYGRAKATGMPANTLHFRHYYEGGVDLRYRHGKHLSLTTGIEYANIKDHTGPYYFEQNFNPITGQLVGEPLNIWYTYHQLRIPVLAGYERAISHRLSAGVFAGPAFNYLLDAKGSYTADPTIDIALNEAKDFRRLQVGFSAQLSVIWQCSRNVALALSPAYNFSSVKSNRSYTSAERFSVAGVRIGTVIRL